MAETMSVEYTAAYSSSPRGNNYAYHRHGMVHFTYVQAANGTAADTILLCKIPPHATLIMWESWFEWSGWTSGATLSIGWKAYKDEDGTTQALSATGLLNVVSLTAEGGWSHGMLVVATPDDSVPVVGRKVFNNREPVTLYATIGTQAPGAADILNGGFKVYTG